VKVNVSQQMGEVRFYTKFYHCRREYSVLQCRDESREFACESCGAVQCRDLSAAKSVANTGEKDLIANGILVRALPKPQQKSPSKMKVFEQSKFGLGSEKKDAA
jgi:transposase